MNKRKKPSKGIAEAVQHINRISSREKLEEILREKEIQGKKLSDWDGPIANLCKKYINNDEANFLSVGVYYIFNEYTEEGWNLSMILGDFTRDFDDGLLPEFDIDRPDVPFKIKERKQVSEKERKRRKEFMKEIGKTNRKIDETPEQAKKRKMWREEQRRKLAREREQSEG